MSTRRHLRLVAGGHHHHDLHHQDVTAPEATHDRTNRGHSSDETEALAALADVIAGTEGDHDPDLRARAEQQARYIMYPEERNE